MHAEGDGVSQQSHRAALDRYALSRPQLRRADAQRVPMDVSSSAQNSAATATAREQADPVSGGITLTGGAMVSMQYDCHTTQWAVGLLQLVCFGDGSLT